MTRCGNETDGDVGEAAIGYWSRPQDSDKSIIVKWVTGHPFSDQFNDSTSLTGGNGYNSHVHWIWKDVPKVTALNCTPIFESANANVTVDLASGVVQEHKILDTLVKDSSAWKCNYVGLNVSSGVPYSAQLYGGASELVDGIRGTVKMAATRITRPVHNF
jgi:hypothetical protein